ncbi:MAG: hypothetical protein JWN46_2704, partial [Acidimicrobiales bacterium]|nr:hypothetical protein [Acidimicrobiales bacterium]
MPSWNPEWSDVRFDHPTAEWAAAACERAARVVTRTGSERSQLVRLAVATGRGPRIDVLARRNARLSDTDQQVVATLLLVATRLRTASAEASVDQAGREADRVRWRAAAADETRWFEA